MSGMISAVPNPPLDTLTSQLTQMAQALATAHAQSVSMATAQDPQRWRQADLVWPLFTSSLMKKA